MKPAAKLLVIRIALVSMALAVGTPGGTRPAPGPVAGQTVYEHHCAACHDQTAPQIPPRSALEMLSTTRILRTLDFGAMMTIASPLRREERVAVAKYLGTTGNDEPLPPSAFCGRDTRHDADAATPSWPGWSPTVTNSRFQSAADAGLAAGELSRLKLKWAFGYRGDIVAFAAPTVHRGTLYVGSAGGSVHALDALSGCIYWEFEADGTMRAAPLIHQFGSRQLLLFGDLTGSFYALDAANGHAVWKRRIDEHEATRLTGSAAALADLVYVPAASWEETRAVSPEYACCTFRGSVTALHAADGSVAWKRYLVGTSHRTGAAPNGTPRFGPSGAPVWSAPTIDVRRGILYIATGDNYSAPATATNDAVIALDLTSGRIVWSQQTTAGDAYNRGCVGNDKTCPGVTGPDFDYGASPILVHAGGRDLLVAGQKSGVVYAFDPEAHGKILWHARVGNGGINGGVQWGMTADERYVYASVNDAVRTSDTPTLSGSPPGEFEPTKGGGLTALDLVDGRTVWYAPGHPCVPPRAGCSPGQPQALSAIPGAVFSGSTDGHLRAFATDDGRLLWDVDAAREYQTVNGISGKGGALDGAGPVIVGGMLYVNSGYARFGGTPGNVLLAFSVDGR